MSDIRKNEMESECVLVLSVVRRDSVSGARNNAGRMCVCFKLSAPVCRAADRSALVQLHHETKNDIAIIAITPSPARCVLHTS